MTAVTRSGPPRARPRTAVGRAMRRLGEAMPKGLYPRSLIIIVAPMVLLQLVVGLVFMDRHYETVTRRLSSALTADLAALAELYERERIDPAVLQRLARERLHYDLVILPAQPLPPANDAPMLSILHSTLAGLIREEVRRPFWIDTETLGSAIEIRIALKDAVMRVRAARSQAFASNSHIFIVWMLGTALVLLLVAILFLRNQIRPILRLAEAAEEFGKGRDVADFRPRGAREVRRAASAFLEMRARIERQIEQRTTMLAGVSHDLRTILTRFRLQLALLPESPETEDLTRDVDEMSRMLEHYLAFVRGDAGEPPTEIDVEALLGELQRDCERVGHSCSISFTGDPKVLVRQDAFKRCLGNLVSNANRFGTKVALAGRRDSNRLIVTVDDDGPGVPPKDRELVFRPFLRLDDSRNQDHGGSGLGLAIARDIARNHGGDVILGDSPLGGLRATVSIPV